MIRFEVFLYKDSSDRLIATTREPKLMLGEMQLRGCRRAEHDNTGVDFWIFVRNWEGLAVWAVQAADG